MILQHPESILYRNQSDYDAMPLSCYTFSARSPSFFFNLFLGGRPGNFARVFHAFMRLYRTVNERFLFVVVFFARKIGGNEAQIYKKYTSYDLCAREDKEHAR